MFNFFYAGGPHLFSRADYHVVLTFLCKMNFVILCGKVCLFVSCLSKIGLRDDGTLNQWCRKPYLSRREKNRRGSGVIPRRKCLLCGTKEIQSNFFLKFLPYLWINYIDNSAYSSTIYLSLLVRLRKVFLLFIFFSVNYRGSSGFGHDFVLSLQGKIGSQDVYDVHVSVLI